MKRTSLFFITLILLGITGCSQDEPGYLAGPGDPVSTASDDHRGGKVGPGDIHMTSAAPEIGGISHVGVILMNFANTPPQHRFDATDEATILDFMFNDTPGAKSIHNLFLEMSYGVDGFTGEIIDTCTISWDYSNPCPQTASEVVSTAFAWNEEARALVQAQGAVLDPEYYDLLVLMTPSGGTCDGPFGGVNGVAYRMSNWPLDIPEVSILNWDVPTTTAHEIGHIRGFGHSGVQGVNAYADLSCVMGDNYDYAPPLHALHMRQANGYWKYYAGYFLPEDIYELTDAGGTHTVYLAPTERPSAAIEDPPGETAYHIVKINSINQSTPFYLSFRSSDPAYTDFDDHEDFTAWMDRTQVQKLGGGDVYQQALLEAGQVYEGENFMVTAVNDGLTGDPYIELTVVMYDKLAPELSVEPVYHVSNNTATGVAPETYTLTVTNIDPAHIGPTTFDLSGTGDPDIFTVEFSSPQITLDPGESGAVTVSLNFNSAPVEELYMISITVSDPVGPRSDATAGASYIVDLTPPTDPTGLAGGAGDSSATLSWNASDDLWPIVYHVERNGEIVGTTSATEYLDDGLEPNTTYEYRVVAYDEAGNPSGFSNMVVLTTDCANGFTAEFSPLVLYRTAPMYKQGINPGTFSMTITNHNHPTCTPVQYTVTGDCSAANYYFNAPQPTLEGGETVEEDALLAWFVQPWYEPANGTVTIDVTVDDNNPDIPPQTFDLTYVYDTVDPAEPGDLVADVSASDVTLTWTASYDATAGVSHYEVFRGGNSLGTTPDLTWTDNFTPTTCVIYEVRAYDAAGRFSTDAGVVVGAAPTVWIEPATMVTNETTFQVTIYVTNNDDAGCDWGMFEITPVSNPDLTITPDIPGLVINAGETGSTQATVTITDSPADDDYNIEITADDSSTPRLAQTASVTYTVDAVDPTAPTNLTGTMSPFDEVTLAWNAATDGTSGVAYYEIQRNDVVIGTTTDLTYLDSVNTFQILWYRVRAVDNAGNTGPWSNKFKTGCPKCPRPVEI